ncbi:DUF2628 domain-containing protein [Bacillus sp. S70]|uniref:DUF2628 domain-containing protein n=1 Tax=unclassified Bacillus (in: firmicutes) TaxID=185979 RepID=UPI00190A922F|nr:MULTISPECIES: DUF2628 domain-containing protein [unclassified Bacillus (in: firmicutes)]MBJ9980426.1 DUF2628 domain-containing protein [Bacillus sp. S29]MBK0101298.1 DUF2628 domain-containing protein [Bacillus sp. S70]MBK0106315.1 DUF2628 domain-containing protein [Bacillus sp. S73]MBK0135053.1 DUF2628 domain-containing protein [Bacillus sp. S72]MBK0149649.1 DUF2628 domain-containing protein [Bacillus sp. S74]
MKITNLDGEATSFPALLKIVQNKKSYYDFKWGEVKDPAKENTWNWIAFFFTLFWIAYRKMYKLFFLLGLLQIPWFIIFHLIDIPLWVDIVLYLEFCFVVGWNGNRWYFKHAIQILGKVKSLPQTQQDLYLRAKGGTHIEIMLCLNLFLLSFLYIMDIKLAYLPTQTNVKNVVRWSEEGETLESFTTNSKWKYIKKEGKHYVVEFTGYDNSEKEHVQIVFYVYLEKQNYEWHYVYINNKKLNKDDKKEYKKEIEEISWY